MKILFVCSANVDRSPTAEKVINEMYPDIETRSTGILAGARVPVDEALIQWADVILCMENWPHRQFLLRKYSKQVIGKEMESLDIPDDYEYMESHLITQIKEKFNIWLSRYNKKNNI